MSGVRRAPPLLQARSHDARRRIESVARASGSCSDRELADVVELVRDHLAIATSRHGEWIALEAFTRHALAHAALSQTGFLARLATLHSADLYLALAAALDAAPAVARLEHDHISRIGQVVSRVDGGAPYAEEIQRRATSVLLEAPAPRAVLLDYSGRSSLRDWMRVRVVRELLALRGARRPEALVTSPIRTADRLQRSGARPQVSTASSSVV